MVQSTRYAPGWYFITRDPPRKERITKLRVENELIDGLTSDRYKSLYIKLSPVRKLFSSKVYSLADFYGASFLKFTCTEMASLIEYARS